MVNGIVRSVLSAVAAQERITIREHTKTGLRRAVKDGATLGRRPVTVDVARALQKEGLGLRGIAKKMHISVNTLVRSWCRQTNSSGYWLAASGPASGTL
jgi:DNA invertase Pin-like site-specific DNA recombinase